MQALWGVRWRRVETKRGEPERSDTERVTLSNTKKRRRRIT